MTASPFQYWKAIKERRTIIDQEAEKPMRGEQKKGRGGPQNTIGNGDAPSKRKFRPAAKAVVRPKKAKGRVDREKHQRAEVF